MTRETKVVHTTDRFSKVVLSIIALCFVLNTAMTLSTPVEAQINPQLGHSHFPMHVKIVD